MQRLLRKGEAVKEAAQAILSAHDSTGDLSASLIVEVTTSAVARSTVVRVFSPLGYAEAVEHGTGPQWDGEGVGLGRYEHPPNLYDGHGNTLFAWASDHGLNPWAVRRNIELFGTPAVHYLRDALAAVAGA